MSDCGEGLGSLGGRPARQSSANFLSRLKMYWLANDDSDDYEDDGAKLEGDTDYNPGLGKKELGRKTCVEMVEMTDEDSNEQMESLEDLIGTSPSLSTSEFESDSNVAPRGFLIIGLTP